MTMIKLNIQGKSIEMPSGITIPKAARGSDIFIPALCSHPDIPQEEEIETANVP